MLTAENLTLERYFEPVFEPVSLSVDAGDLLLVTGANGSGKTTLIRLLAGLLQPSAGRVHLAVDSLAYLGHTLAVKDDLTVRENLRFQRRFLAGTRGSMSLDPILERMGLRRVAEQLGRTLSAGQRKRCALARLLLTAAPLWLLDEPYANLDAEGLALFDGLLSAQLRGGGACVMSTHGSLRPEQLSYRECELSAWTRAIDERAA